MPSVTANAGQRYGVIHVLRKLGFMLGISFSTPGRLGRWNGQLVKQDNNRGLPFKRLTML